MTCAKPWPMNWNSSVVTCKPPISAKAFGPQPSGKPPHLQAHEGDKTVSKRQFQGPLAGIRVIDLTRVYAGPLCTQTLADQGADVIKVEPPVGDETRNWGTVLDQDRSTYFNGLNRNKRSVALDLGKDAGREALLSLLEGADVLVHNFKLGTLPKWGLGYDEVLSKRFPRLVQCTI